MNTNNYNIKYLLILLFFVGYYTSGKAQSNMLIADVRIKAVDAQNGLDHYIKNALNDIFLSSQNMLNLTDRDHLTEIEYIRKTLMKNENVKTVALLGAQYSINSTVSNRKQNIKPHNYLNKAGVNKLTHYSASMSYDLNIEIVEIETGEVISKNKISPNGWAYTKNTGNKETITELLYQDVMADMVSCLRRTLTYDFYYFINPQLDILYINQTKKNKAKKIITYGSMEKNLAMVNDFNVFKKSVTEINGKKINRSILIGKAKINTKYPTYMEFKVTNGGEEILQAFNNEDELFLEVIKPLFSNVLVPKSRDVNKKKLAAEEAALRPKPKPTKDSSSSNKKKKTVKRKTVKRKK